LEDSCKWFPRRFSQIIPRCTLNAEGRQPAIQTEGLTIDWQKTGKLDFSLSGMTSFQMKRRESTESPEYWNSVAENLLPEVSCGLWRRYADALNASLIERFLPGSIALKRALKTDLFDESLGLGLAQAMNNKSQEAWGIDLSFSTARSASRKNSDCIPVNSDIRNPGFRKGSFSLVVSNSTLDHFSSEDEIREALRAISFLLEPGGHLIWTMDNPLNPIIWIRNTLSRRYGTLGTLLPYQMGKTWSLGRMAREIGRLGFLVRETGFFMHCPRMPVIRMLKFMDASNKRRAGEKSLQLLHAIEKLEALPTRQLTAYYSALHATKE